MRTEGLSFITRLKRLAGLALLMAVLASCGSSGSSGSDAEAGQTETTVAADSAATDAAETTIESAAEEPAPVDDCDYSTFTYTPFTEIPADWPAAFPRPENLEEIDGEVGVGCERVTVDMRGRFYGNSREWLAAYGDQLTAAGFTLDDESDDGRDVNLTYRSGQNWISYGGTIEQADTDSEYIGVGIVLTDFG